MTHAPAVVIASDAEATEAAGEGLAADLLPGDVVSLQGALAAGKTTLVRGIVRGLGGDPDEVSSPTFVLVQSYPLNGPVHTLHHVDLYRLQDDPASLREVGIEDVLADDGAVVAVEWPRQLLAPWMPHECRLWGVAIERADGDTRRIEITPPP